MLLTFQVENWGSFYHQTTFSMRATREQAHKETLHTLRGQHILPVSAIYGANAAGKSQFVKALKALRQLALDRDLGVDAATNPHLGLGADSPSKFLIEFAVERERGTLVFIYEAHVQSGKVIFEELVKVGWESEFVLYRRTAEHGFEFFEGLESDQSVLACATIVSPSQTLLSMLLFLEEIPPLVDPVLEWFAVKLMVLGTDYRHVQLPARVLSDPDFKRGLLEFIHTADSGIEEIDFTGVELRSTGMRHDELERVRQALLSNPKIGGCVVGAGTDYYLLELDGRQLTAKLMVARHGNNFTLPLSDESDGTVKLLNILPYLLAIRAGEPGMVLVADELESSLHSVLIRRFVLSFIESAAEAKYLHQLIFTTHDTAIMRKQLLRRDEIWFVEKQQDSSELYRLSEYKLKTNRKGNDIEKMYLDGQLGAITRPGVAIA